MEEPGLSLALDQYANRDRDRIDIFQTNFPSQFVMTPNLTILKI
jgi:hypothetical protein